MVLDTDQGHVLSAFDKRDMSKHFVALVKNKFIFILVSNRNLISR